MWSSILLCGKAADPRILQFNTRTDIPLNTDGFLVAPSSSTLSKQSSSMPIKTSGPAPSRCADVFGLVSSYAG